MLHLLSRTTACIIKSSDSVILLFGNNIFFIFFFALGAITCLLRRFIGFVITFSCTPPISRSGVPSRSISSNPHTLLYISTYNKMLAYLSMNFSTLSMKQIPCRIAQRLKPAAVSARSVLSNVNKPSLYMTSL